MDTEFLREMYKTQCGQAGRFSRRVAINIADYFGMKPMSMVWRLEKLGIAKRGAWQWFKDNGGITEDHVNQVRQERIK